MDALVALLLLVCLGVLLYALFKVRGELAKAKAHAVQVQTELDAVGRESELRRREIESLTPFAQVRDAALEASGLLEEAKRQASALRSAGEVDKSLANLEADQLRQAVGDEVRAKRQAADLMLEQAGSQAAGIVDEARKNAEAIGGDAYRALEDAKNIAATVQAMKNVIDGYGNRYMIPTHSLLDDLAEAYSHEEAGRELKQARERTKRMVVQGIAADCDYVEKVRKETAIRFVTDAFNGKADSILSRAKIDNFGTLQQELRDAVAIVNANGTAFKSARIKPEYVESRIQELQWAVRVNELREREREEQRRIREQIREEEKARREYERAIKEAAKEEDTIRKAMEKAQAQVAKASDEQRAKYEALLAELQGKLLDAESKNQRALSMAQQTKAGHVYVISNVGSFGEHVYKVGMTRRMEPLDRIRELGDASVPFGFDVHAMIWSDNAPQLETKLHRMFVQAQVNKLNPRKEFFRVGITDLRVAMENMGLNVSWTMAAEAREYRETLAIEKQIEESELARQVWVSQQLVYEASMAAEDPDDEGGAAQIAGPNLATPGQLAVTPNSQEAHISNLAA
ncbi:DUF4041 domain-containing protein [Aquabacterium sp. CECT 9606]|uniref:DUF4041 domain-containing protein n=1 Tax=Aquabacterium sp. CECT 9606 TaxID=2845822 RepID=UPI001E576AF0|nr:DUF4041 domain-containing protein [Aquabacterium sp. CECT 9606]CAH0354237.1 hypothetical protein AQB9606_03614 [Aquabacterium sp. CECT 9606]